MKTIALIGNQNSGKTTLFNALTGSNQKIGNWPGVTIEKKTGMIRGTDARLVDLPGIYSLSPYSTEEEISRGFLFDETPDAVINIVDATSFERSLYLTTQLRELDCPVIVVLNMSDILKKKGLTFDVESLKKRLKAPVFLLSALKKTGVNDLIHHIMEGRFDRQPPMRLYADDIEEAIDAIEKDMDGPHTRFRAVKALENDPLIDASGDESVGVLRQHLEDVHGMQIEHLIAKQRYDGIVRIKDAVLHRRSVRESATDRLDRIFLNKYLALPIFALIMFLIYFLAVGVVGQATVDAVDGSIGVFGDWLRSSMDGWGVSSWLISLVVDGMVAGVGAVLTFVPQLIILFIAIGFLETTGWISFFLDRIFRRLGLSGKVLIPFIVGTGCSVPAVMSTRVIEDDEEREMAIVLTPFVPCSAKLPIIALFAGFFFERYASLAAVSLYLMAIAIIIVAAVLLRKFVYKKSQSTYLIELPEYKWPNPVYLARDVWDRIFSFIKRAGTVILIASVVIWFLLSFNWRLQFGIGVEDSMLASIGRVFAFVFYPMLGELSWGATVSAVQGLVAKEQVVSSMAVISGMSDTAGSGSGMFAAGRYFAFFTPASALAFMAFNLFSAPCFATIGAMRRELHSTKKMLRAVAFQTGLAWVVAVLIYQIGTWIGG